MESSDLCVSLSLSSFHAVAPRQLIIDSESVGLLVDQSKALFPQRPSVNRTLSPPFIRGRAIVFPTSAAAAAPRPRPRLSLPPSDLSAGSPFYFLSILGEGKILRSVILSARGCVTRGVASKWG